MFILFFMMLCTTYSVQGMNAIVDQKQGTLNIFGFDLIYSNNVTDDGKGGAHISSTPHPLCLIATFVPTDPKSKPEDVMILIEGINPGDIPDNTSLSLVTHKTNKSINMIMSQTLRCILKDALCK